MKLTTLVLRNRLLQMLRLSHLILGVEGEEVHRGGDVD